MSKLHDPLIEKCENLIQAYRSGGLGDCRLPEDNAPSFAPHELEQLLIYYTLPMAVNYRRNSTQLWEAARSSYDDPATKAIYSVEYSSQVSQEVLKEHLLKYRVAMQPNRHTLTWQTIAKTIQAQWGSIEQLLASTNFDFIELRNMVQNRERRGFPYLAGPKLFNYWCFILGEKCGIELSNKEHIDIAVDTHVLKCSIRLGVITEEESRTLSTSQIAGAWRSRLKSSHIAPTSLNVPLWFWSRSGFTFKP